MQNAAAAAAVAAAAFECAPSTQRSSNERWRLAAQRHGSGASAPIPTLFSSLFSFTGRLLLVIKATAFNAHLSGEDGDVKQTCLFVWTPAATAI